MKLEIRKIREMSRKLKTVRETREKSENIAKFSGKLKFLALKKINITLTQFFLVFSI